MFFLVSLTIGLIILLIATIFLSAVVYHLFQYQLPNRNYRQPIAIIAILFLVFVFVGCWIFSGVPWNTI